MECAGSYVLYNSLYKGLMLPLQQIQQVAPPETLRKFTHINKSQHILTFLSFHTHFYFSLQTENTFQNLREVVYHC